MNFVDKQHLPGLQAGQHGRHVAGVLQRRPGCHPHGCVEFRGDDRRKGCLTQARWPAEQNVVGDTRTTPSCLQDEPELVLHPVLADEFGQRRRTQSTFDDRIVVVRCRIEDGHDRSKLRRASLSNTPMSGDCASVTSSRRPARPSTAASAPLALHPRDVRPAARGAPSLI